MFAPDGVGMHLADLGAEVVKVEQPGIGDPARLLGNPYRGESPATRRWNRGKRSVTLDLRTPTGRAVFLELVAWADAVIEGMRAGALDRRGLGYPQLLSANPRLVFASVSGWGREGPYRDLGSHGLAFDAFAGLAPPRMLRDRSTRPSGHVWQGIEAAPLHAALAIVAGVLRARLSGLPAAIEVSEADAAAVWNGHRIAFEAAVAAHGSEPVDADTAELVAALDVAAEGAGRTGEDELTASDVRYQYYAASDGIVLLMATENRFWENFCRAVDRADWLERWPSQGYADHAYGNEALRSELDELFATRTRAEWIQLFIEHDVAGAPVYGPGETHRDPHFVARGLWLDQTEHGSPQLGSPIRVDGEYARPGARSPTIGEHTEEVLRDVLGYDDDQIAVLSATGALGAGSSPTPVP